MMDIHFLWINSQPLSNLEKMCLKSHINNNHSCILWSYDTNIQYPNGIKIRDANTIIPKDKTFTYKKQPFKNNLAGFSDLFRYKVLYEYGGWWCDTDVLCVKKFDIQSEYVFASEKKINQAISIAPSVIKCPKGNDFIRSCIEDAEDKLRLNQNIGWGEIAHKILNKNIQKHGLEKFIVNHNIFCPVDWFKAHLFFQPNQNIDISSSYGIHLWNTCIKRKNINKSTPIKNSYFDYFMKINNVSVHQ